MQLPFTQSQFLENFARYNEAVFPMQFVFVGLALVAVVLAIRSNKHSNKIIGGILAFFWLWMGIVYHIVFFSDINKAAYIFGTLFVIQGILFAVYGVLKGKLVFVFQRDRCSIIGLTFIWFALVVYPILGYAFGHAYPHNPTFGLPCPTTIFTFGILLMASNPVKKSLIVFPFIWSLIGFNAALALGIKEDTGLLIAGLLGSVLILLKNRQEVT